MNISTAKRNVTLSYKNTFFLPLVKTISGKFIKLRSEVYEEVHNYLNQNKQLRTFINRRF